MANAAAASSITNKGGYLIDIEIPTDAAAKRDKVSRWTTALLTTTATIGIPIAIGAWWGSWIAGSFGAKVGILVGLGGAAWIGQWIIPRLFVYVREWSAFVTQDVLTGDMVPYGPGLNPSHVWETRGQDGNYPLDVITRTIDISVQTTTAAVTVDISFQYMVDLEFITNFVGVDDDTTILNGFAGFIESFISEKIAAMDAEAARKSIGDINQMLAQGFGGHTDEGGQNRVDFEHKFGIKTVSIVVKGIRFPAAAQKTRDAIDEAETLHKVVAALIGISPDELKQQMKDGKITKEDYRDYLDKAMATSDNAKLDIKALRVDVPGLNEIVEKLFNAFSGGKK